MSAFIGLIISAVYKILGDIFHLWPETARFTLPAYKKLVFSCDGTPALLGVGYIIGAKLSITLLAGSITSWWLFIPFIDFFAGSSPIFPSMISIAKMSADD